MKFNHPSPGKGNHVTGKYATQPLYEINEKLDYIIERMAEIERDLKYRKRKN